ncbi:MAG: hypothetical protein M1818_001039 [Claussenomyces sp. TS43310]|nr:MAG: hypothetical protein M1818_001039 [Claussenomyces sp. TS43310]
MADVESKYKLDEERLLSEYEKESTVLEESAEPKISRRIKLRHSLWQTTNYACNILTFLLGLSILVLLVVHDRSSHSSPAHSESRLQGIHWKDCGTTAAEAQLKNCRFDLMLTSWLHADCFDSQLMERYLSEHDYKWYADSDLKTILPDDGALHRVFVEKEFHFVHCAYMWEMQMRAYRSGKAIDHNIWQYEHTVHCAKLLVSQQLPRNFTVLTVKFDSCGIP